MSDAVQEIEDFYGVYLLVSKSPNPKFAGKTYIGYTVDPNRRIKQHNGGKDAGGAKRTSNRGPWMMVLIVHGFPNNISALRFEWAWQQPNVSRRLKLIPELQRKQRKETNIGYSFRILTEMLRIGPWNRLPLTVRWLVDEFHREFEVGKTPPLHMPICFGRVKKAAKKGKRQPPAGGTQPCNATGATRIKKIVVNYDFDEYDMLVMNGRGDGTESVSEKEDQLEGDERNIDDNLDDEDERTIDDCTLCEKRIVVNDGEGFCLPVRCIQPRCELVCHIECLAGRLLEPGQYVPIEGDCPVCDTHFLWGDVIRKANGCNDWVDDLNCTEALEVDDVSDEEEDLEDT